MFALAYKVEGQFDWEVDYNYQYEYQDSAESDLQRRRMNLPYNSHCEIKVVEI